MSSRLSMACLVVLSLGGCEDKLIEKVPPAQGAEAAKPSDSGKTPPAPTAPAKWSSVDAKGHDWAAQMGDIRFDTDWKAAMARAKASKRPLMFLFTEKTNAESVKMAGTTFKDPKVIEASAVFEVALVDAEADAALAERYTIRDVPTIVYADSNGEAANSTLGASASVQVLADIKSALDTLKEDEADK